MNKKLPLILFFAVVLCYSSQAQYVSIHAEDPYNPGGTQTIVRSWNSRYAVSYYVDASLNPTLDVVEQSTGTIYRAILPDNMYLRDMVIDQASDMLYFCGATTMYSGSGPYTGIGLMGWVDLNSFFSTNISMGYLYATYALGGSQYSINKLVEYNDNGVPHIIALAEQYQYIGGALQPNQYFFSCLDITGLLPSLSVGLFPANEHYYEVVLTDNYVVFMGYDSSPSVNALCYRKEDPWNFPDTMLYDKHYFVNGNDPLSPTLSTKIYGDIIATSYLARNDSYDDVTRIRMIDFATDANINSQEFSSLKPDIPEGIVYVPYDKSLVLMERFFSPSGNHASNFVFLDPLRSTSYSSTIEHKEKEYFHALTMHDDHYYLAGAGASWFLRDKPLPPTNHPYKGCPLSEKLDVKPVGNLVSNYMTLYTLYIQTELYNDNMVQTVIHSTAQIICYND